MRVWQEPEANVPLTPAELDLAVWRIGAELASGLLGKVRFVLDEVWDNAEDDRYAELLAHLTHVHLETACRKGWNERSLRKVSYSKPEPEPSRSLRPLQDPAGVVLPDVLQKESAAPVPDALPRHVNR